MYNTMDAAASHIPTRSRAARAAAAVASVCVLLAVIAVAVKRSASGQVGPIPLVTPLPRCAAVSGLCLGNFCRPSDHDGSCGPLAGASPHLHFSGRSATATDLSPNSFYRGMRCAQRGARPAGSDRVPRLIAAQEHGVELMWGGPLSFDMVHTHILNMKMRRSRLKEKLKQQALIRKDKELAKEHGFNVPSASPAAQQQMAQAPPQQMPQYQMPPQQQQMYAQQPPMYQQPPQYAQQPQVFPRPDTPSGPFRI